MRSFPTRIRPLAAGLTIAPAAWGAAALAVTWAALVHAQVLTSQYDNRRTGCDPHETVLTPRNVNAKTFGRLFRIAADGDVLAQPLVLPHLTLPGRGVHDVLFVATEHGSVEAWDADRASEKPLWHVSFVNPGAGVTTIPFRDLQCPFIRPEVGITPTPVIDAASGTLYVLMRTRERAQDAVRYAQRLHALDVRTGAERPGSPVEIRARSHGSGEGADADGVAFDPLRENPRASLLLVHGRVIVCWASSCDVGPYHGWVMAYDARTLRQDAALDVSPHAAQGGIWQSDTGPAADAAGRVFAITGNGRFDAAGGGADWGNSVLALEVAGAALRIADSFTPHDQAELDAMDGDLGSGGPVLAGGDASGPERLVFASKAGSLYVLDPAHLGGFREGADSGAVQVLPHASHGEYGAPAYWNGHVYLQGSDAPLRDYALAGGRLAPDPLESTSILPNPGATPTVSANAGHDGIVWMLQSKPFGTEDRPAILHAFDAADVRHELYTSEQVPARDRAGIALRFNIPTVWNGRVYVGARGGIDVYGLLR
jgi:hypothetical protein